MTVAMREGSDDNEESTWRALIDPQTHAVYGVGTNAKEAREMAHAEISDLDVQEGKRWDDGLDLVDCTEAAAIYVTKHGGAPSNALTVSGRYGVMLRSEEEAL